MRLPSTLTRPGKFFLNLFLIDRKQPPKPRLNFNPSDSYLDWNVLWRAPRSSPCRIARSNVTLSSMNTEELLTRLARIEPTHLADANKQLRIMDPGIRPVRLGIKLLGRAYTVRALDDFMTIIVALAEAQAGEVLVVDTGNSQRAVVGELFSYEAQRRGLAGIVVDGPIRDTVTLRKLDLPVYARSSTPVAGTTLKLFERQQPILCGGVMVHPGDILFGDDDGIVVASEAEIAAILPAAEQIDQRERIAIARMQAGDSLHSMLNYAEHRAALEGGRDSALRFLI
ncbi:MAG: RraA family protein [Gammaproteobacteria bacterium]|nr:RraA family protein [Gammaproteobacteria bacterium]